MGKRLLSRQYVYRIGLALLLLVLFVFGSNTAPVHAQLNTTRDEIKHIDEYVQSEMQAASIPGMAYGIVKDGQIIHLAAYGVRGPNGQPMTTQTPIQIGSVGFSFEYSNLNYLILGLVVQYTSGQSYEQYVQEHIFDQLEMRHSYVSETNAQQHGLAEGYRIVFGVPLATHIPYPGGLVATGYQISSAEDMAHYLAAFSNQGYYKGISIVTPGEIQSDKDTYYDVDWNPIQLSDTRYGFGHSGKNPNYAAHIQIWPYGHLGVVVLTNENTSSMEVIPTKNASTIADDVFRMYHGLALTKSVQSIEALYIVFDILVLLVIAALVWHASRLRNWGKRVSHAKGHLRAYLPSMLTDGILPLCLLLIPPIVLTFLGDAPRFSPVKDWEILLLIVPDIGYTLFAIALILLVIGTVKLIWVSRQGSSG